MTKINQGMVPGEELGEQKFIKAREEIVKIFQSNKTGNERVGVIVSKIKPLISDEQLGIITPVLQEMSTIEDEGAFVEGVLSVLKPIIELKKRVDSKTITQRHGFTELNEVLSYGIGDGLAHIHAGSFRRRPIEEGLRKLAEIIKKNEDVRVITASSWIVARKPEWLEDLGFTDTGPISEEEREKHFKDDTRPINKAVMSREDFLKRYLS